MEEMEYYEVEKVLAQYKDVISKHFMWEKGHFYLAKYYEKLMNSVDTDPKERKKIWKKCVFPWLPLVVLFLANFVSSYCTFSATHMF